MTRRTDHGAGRGRPWAAVVVWAFVGVAALTLLPLPFTGDQALYLDYGRRLARGAVLYRDVWDVKQPAIFWFNTGAGSLFGFNEVAVHLAEAVWWIGGAVLAQRAWRARLDSRVAEAAVPLLTAGVLLASARMIDIGQVEQLVGLPLLASWWLVQHPDPDGARGRGRLAAAGALAAVVALFKHLYLPIAVAFLVLAALRLAVRAGRARALRAAAWWAAGLALALAPFAVQVVATGQVHRVWWTFVTATGQMRALAPPPFGRLVRSLAHLGVVALPLVALAAIGWRRAWHPVRRAGTVDMVAWIGIGGAALAVQLWWTYQQLLVIVPLGLLASHGVDELAERWAGARRARLAAGVVALALLASVAPLAGRIVHLARHGGALTVADRAQLRADLEPAEVAAARTAALLRRPDGRPGPVIVLGNPVHLLRSGREQAGAVHGWSPEFNTPELWAEVEAAARAPDTAYVGIDDDSRVYVDERAPALLQVLAERYRPLPRAPGDALAWWERLGP